MGQSRLLVKTGYGGMLICPSTDLSLTPFLALTGTYEGPLTNYLSHFVKPGHIVVDIGANIGYFSVLFGHLVGLTGQLYAYEANPHLIAFLQDNLSLNALREQSTVKHRAVCNQEGSLTFHITKRFMGNSSIHKHDSSYSQLYEDQLETVDVQAVKLDDELLHLPHIDWLKLDIEGGEYEAFLGMERLLHKVKVTIFEVNRVMLQERWLPFTQLLKRYEKEWGKRFYTLAPDGAPVSVAVEQVIQEGKYPYLLMC